MMFVPPYNYLVSNCCDGNQYIINMPSGGQPGEMWYIESVEGVNFCFIIENLIGPSSSGYDYGANTASLVLNAPAVCGSAPGYCCAASTPTPTPTKTKTPTPTPTKTKTPTPTPTKTITPTKTSTPTKSIGFTPTPTKTTTPTVTPTITNTPSVTPSISVSRTPYPEVTVSLRLTGKNECDVITIYPMEVQCQVVQEPSGVGYSDGIISLLITGGTAPYSIQWSNGQTSQTLNNVSYGFYTAVVTDYYGDFSSTTTCGFYVPTPTPTSTPTTTPTMTPSQSVGSEPLIPNLCMSFTYCEQSYLITFINNGTQNSHYSWISENGQYFILHNGTDWEFVGLVMCGSQTPQLKSTTTSLIPNNGWAFLGGGNTTSGLVVVTEGTCSSQTLSLTYTVNNACTNNGSILATANGGAPPYTYSIDNITYQNSPLFNNLVSGNYTLYVMDNNGNTSNAGVTVSQTQNQNYVINVNFVGNPTGNYTTTNWNSNPSSIYTTTITNGRLAEITITPSLPSGVIVEFDLSFTSQITQSPQYVSSDYYSWGTNNTVEKNSILQTPIIQPQVTTDFALAGCKGALSAKTVVLDVSMYNALQITSSDTYNLAFNHSILIGNKPNGTFPCNKKYSYLLKYQLRNVKLYNAPCSTVSIGNDIVEIFANLGQQFFGG